MERDRLGLDTRRRALGGVRMSQESSLQTDGEGFTTQQVLQLTRPAIVTPSLPPQRPAHGPTADSGDETSPRTGFTLQFEDPHGLSRGRHFSPPAEAGVPRITFHDLRHTYATAALEGGVAMKVVSERIGHSNVSFTMQTYAHVRAEADHEAAQQAADFLLGDTGKEAGVTSFAEVWSRQIGRRDIQKYDHQAWKRPPE